MSAATKSDPALILLASSRRNGNSRLVADRLRRALDAPASALIDLAAMELRAFDYDAVSEDDGLRPLLKRFGSSRHAIFATPVYWYAMSAPMKTFFDRLTDILLDEQSRPLGRALAGTNLWLLANGTDPDMPEGFAEPFRRTADYFGMVWREACYVRVGPNGQPEEAEMAKVDALAARIQES